MPEVAQELDLVAAVTVAQTKKPLPYLIKSHTAPVAGGGAIGRGVNVRSSDPFLIFEDGRAQQALSVQAVAAAIYHGVISRAEIGALWEAADLKSGAAVVAPAPASTPPTPPVAEEKPKK